ncbi:hypothetical protein HW555_000327 [Spodoptera exigua]|uniref:Uncharacterized protein n=1 Tax=Spodoptera exigua TaxID=7107 RepID=A0A835L9S9_SPOEX|nr:hypothetical protein HW555_000327 [Spodoptera exigua]
MPIKTRSTFLCCATRFPVESHTVQVLNSWSPHRSGRVPPTTYTPASRAACFRARHESPVVETCYKVAILH